MRAPDLSADDLFPRFDERWIDTPDARLHVRIGGSGPPLLCIHGYPQTMMMWHRVAEQLADLATVVLIDLRGYGDSSKPPRRDEMTYAKRTLAGDGAAVMTQLGFERFVVLGHDRGARVAYRLALDEPERVSGLVLLDIVPTADQLEVMDAAGADETFHWFFLAQDAPFPERLIGNDPEFFLRFLFDKWAHRREAITERSFAEYLRCFDDATIHATCEDYRAGLAVDAPLDRESFARGHRIDCPLLVLYGRHSAVAEHIRRWDRWAEDLTIAEIDCGHFIAEEAPLEMLTQVDRFLPRVLPDV